jgi:DNA-binding NtrC family response regulator
VAEIITFPGHEAGPADQHVVLVVDDEYLVRGVLSEILRDCGFQVVQAESAARAITILSGPDPVDLVFSDVKMPRMDGFELARWVHDNKPEVPVILASGYSSKTHMASELCGAELLRKPFDFDIIIAKIRDTIERRRPRSA